MPSLHELLKDSGHSFDIFGLQAIQSVESFLVTKNGKTYVHCQVRKKEVLAKPEEIVRQLWIFRLVNIYKYPVERMTVEYPITFGRDRSKRADIVVFDKDRPTVPYLIVENKALKQKDGKDQLKSYTHATGAPLALWSNGDQTVIWHRKNPNYFIEIPDLPLANQTIKEVAETPWTIATLLEFEQERENEGLAARSLKQLILDMEDEVLANAGVDVFEEVFKLVFTKLYDELSAYQERYKHIKFRITNTAAELRERIQNLFADARKQWPGVFPEDDRIKLTPDHLQVCVGSLEKYKLFNSNLDVVDDAFEYLINQTAKGEKGQFFTPRWVIDMCVKMLNPKEEETFIDPACGSAGFTMYAIFKVWRDILDRLKRPQSHLFTMEEKPKPCEDYVRNKVFALDFDEKAVRVARCLNLIAGDGQSNVLHLNTLDYRRWDDTLKDEHWQDVYSEGWRKFKRIRRDPRTKDYRDFQFDVLMANPPFAGDIKQTDMLAPYELAHKANGKLEAKVGRDLLFIERNIDFLRPGGRMAIVLPQGRFNNSSDQPVRQFIAERCRILAVVGLDGHTFKPHTGTKTSVLFVQKWNDDPELGPLCPKVDDYNIFFATQKKPAKDSSGEKIIASKEGEPLRDMHGHWIIQHDLYNTDGLTEDGVAETFQEFARKEKLSFF
jgi:type I restriction enzyme M protein